MFANTQMGVMNLGFPDVCLTPMPPAPPVPIPYPNIGVTTMAIPNIFNMFITAGPVHNLMTTTAMTSGDEAGVAMGVASGLIKGPSRNIVGSATCLFGGMPATRMTSMTIQNNTNSPGVSLTPSQVKVLVLAP